MDGITDWVFVLVLAVVVIVGGLVIFDGSTSSSKQYHILVSGEVYHCNGFEIGDNKVNLSDCQGDYSYTVYNPIGMVVREGD